MTERLKLLISFILVENSLEKRPFISHNVGHMHNQLLQDVFTSIFSPIKGKSLYVTT